MAIGVVAEYNPFHNGHLHHIRETRRQCGDAPVVAVMSGGFVQRGDFAIADKFTRARAAVASGAVDLVVELPVVYSTASAEGFARAAVALLDATGVVDTLSFGSESGDLDTLAGLAAYLNTPAFDADVTERLRSGVSYAAARQQSAASACGKRAAAALSSPNNTLGVEYLRAIDSLGLGITPCTVQRFGAGHDSGEIAQSEAAAVCSASYIRGLIYEGRDIARFLPPAVYELMSEAVAEGAAPPDLALCDAMLMSALRRIAPSGLRNIADVSEGLEYRIAEAVARSCTSEQAARLAQSKRYPLARIRRVFIRAFLGIERDVPPPRYLRVLAISGHGRTLLRRMKKQASLPVITKPSLVALPPDAQRVFDVESLSCDLYNVAKPSSERRTAGDNYRVSPHVVN